MATHIANHHASSTVAPGQSIALPPVPKAPTSPSMRQIKIRILSI